MIAVVAKGSPPSTDSGLRCPRTSAAAARTIGLPARPLEITAADVPPWDRERGAPPLVVGLSPEREAEPLAATR